MAKFQLTDKIREVAKASGIDALRFAAADPFDRYVIGGSRRRDPKLSLPEAKTIIVAGIYIGGVTLPAWGDYNYGRTSRLFLSGFFLDIVKPLEPIAELLEQAGHKAMICKGYSKEESILPLKLAAQRAGLGRQGKHSLLITKKYGTFLALGGILTTAELEHHTKEESDRCRNGTKCQEACPVGALDQAYVLNMKKCMSYRLQVEKLPPDVKAVMENRVLDCEICQDSCPWNKKHIDNPLETRTTAAFREKIKKWEDVFYLPHLRDLTESDFNKLFGRLKADIPFKLFRRNVMIALERSEQAANAGRLIPFSER